MHSNDGRVVSNFVVQALRGDDITLYGDGQQTRSFCYVDDLVEAFIRFMDLPATSASEPGFPGPMNLGNPCEFTICQLAEMVIELTGASSKLVFKPMPSDDPRQRNPQYLDRTGAHRLGARSPTARRTRPHDRVLRRRAVETRVSDQACSACRGPLANAADLLGRIEQTGACPQTCEAFGALW